MQPLVQVFQPRLANGKWYATARLNIHGREVRLIAESDEELMSEIAHWFQTMVQFGPEVGWSLKKAFKKATRAVSSVAKTVSAPVTYTAKQSYKAAKTTYKTGRSAARTTYKAGRSAARTTYKAGRSVTRQVDKVRKSPFYKGLQAIAPYVPILAPAVLADKAYATAQKASELIHNAAAGHMPSMDRLMLIANEAAGGSPQAQKAMQEINRLIRVAKSTVDKPTLSNIYQTVQSARSMQGSISGIPSPAAARLRAILTAKKYRRAA